LPLKNDGVVSKETPSVRCGFGGWEVLYEINDGRMPINPRLTKGCVEGIKAGELISLKKM